MNYYFENTFRRMFWGEVRIIKDALKSSIALKIQYRKKSTDTVSSQKTTDDDFADETLTT